MDFGSLAIALGIGDVPILNRENKRLHEALISKQLDCERIKVKNYEEDESVKRIFGHVTNIKESYHATRHLVTATKETKDSESDLRRIAEINYGRNRKDVHKLQKNIKNLEEKNETLDEESGARETINQLLDEEHETDITTLMKWTSDVEQFEEDIFTLLKFQHKDSTRIKDHHLRLERERERVGQCKKGLDNASTESRMAQVALDKTAEAFRQLHVERSSAMEKWQEALALISQRESEIQEVFHKVTDIKSNVLQLEMEKKEQTAFLDNEKDNVNELQNHVNHEELNYKRLSQTLEKTEMELKEFHSEINLEKRQMWRAGSEMESKKIRMKETKKELNKKKAQVDKLRKDLNEAKDQNVSCNNRALTAEEKACQMQRLLDQDQLQHDIILTDLHKAKERLVGKQKEFKDLEDKEEVNSIRLKGLTQERGNLDKQVTNKKVELIKREDVAVANDQKLVSIEREIARIKGTMSLDNRAELKATLENFKLELDSRSAEKRNLDHLVHKMMCEVKRVKRDIETIDRSQNDYTAKLEEVILVNESCEREQKQLHAKVDALLLDEKTLKLTERKVKEDLEDLRMELTELKKEDLEINEQLREQRAELESKRELYVAQSRCLKDEISTIRNEIHERKDKVEKLKIRYEHTVKAMGETKNSTNIIPNHAKHIVQVAQEKADIIERSDVLAKQIEVEEEELASLEKAMKLMKNSNDSYRVSNCRINGEVQTNQTLDLEESIKNKLIKMKQLKKKLSELGNDIDQVEYLVQKCAIEVQKVQALNESKSIEVKQLEKELHDQDKKVYRAKNVAEKFAGQLKELVPNPEAYEHDMDLREEKEKQRGALILMRELSHADPNFNQRVQDNLSKLGLCIPPVSRLEARATSTRGSTSGGYATASTRFVSSTASSSGGHFRTVQNGGHASDSTMIVYGAPGSGGRSKTAMTVN